MIQEHTIYHFPVSTTSNMVERSAICDKMIHQLRNALVSAKPFEVSVRLVTSGLVTDDGSKKELPNPLKHGKIPDGWELITTGKLESGDKYWSRGKWGFARPAVGCDVATYSCPVIRKLAKPTDTPLVPPGWVVVTEGKREAGDMFWTGYEWTTVESKVGKPVCGYTTIRNQVVRGKPKDTDFDPKGFGKTSKKKC